MAPIRIRHPKGVSTLQVSFEDDAWTVQDLQQAIYELSEILPSKQTLKSGYPPKSLALIPELPFSSLGLKPGDQVIVSGESGATAIDPPRAPPPTSARSAAPAPAARTPIRAPENLKSSSGPEHVEVEGGYLVHRVVPDDNSCLFSAVSLIFEQDISKAQKLRETVVEGIRADPEKYNEAILGMAPDNYIVAISKPSTWGGAIELNILANHYATEIASVDVETGRIDQFTTDTAVNRCIVIYSGIHYDAATLAPMLEAPGEWHQTVFPLSGPKESDPIIKAAENLAKKLREKRAFTNTSTFDLKCQDCGQGLKGESEARVHAAQTGHVNFGEY